MSALLLAGISIDAALSANPALGQTFSCATGINFGGFTTCNSTETATISPANAQTTTGCLSASGAPFNRGICTFTNFTASNFQFSVTATKYNITHTTTTAKMQVDNFSCRFQDDFGTTTGACTYSASPFFVTINIGADLNVNNPQTAGSYSGTYTVQTNIP